MERVRKRLSLSTMNKFIILFFLFFPLISFAQGPCEIVHKEGIVPCRLTECTLCDFFVMLERIVNYILFCLIPPLAVFMIVLAGLLYVGAVFEFLPGGFETVSRAKRIFFSVLIGLFIAYCAWLIINLFLLAIGYKNRNNWWQIQCSQSVPIKTFTLKDSTLKGSLQIKEMCI